MYKINNLIKYLNEYKLDNILITDINDIYYLTGLKVSVGNLWISKNDIKIGVDGRYRNIANNSKLTVIDYKDIPGNIALCGIDLNNLSYNKYLYLSKKFKLFDLSKELTQIRSVKDDAELKKIKKSVSITKELLENIKNYFTIGISEINLKNQLKINALKNNIDGFSFEPIVAFGENSAYPHHVSSNKKLQEGDIILIDFGIINDNYCSDLTRTYLSKNTDSRLKEIYKIVEEAQKLAIASCKEGIKIKYLDSIARDFIAENGFGENFTHSLGHGVGINVHEAPFLHKDNINKLQSGNVITIEPGIYINNLGGVRIEDMVHIKKDSGIVI